MWSSTSRQIPNEFWKRKVILCSSVYAKLKRLTMKLSDKLANKEGFMPAMTSAFITWADCDTNLPKNTQTKKINKKTTKPPKLVTSWLLLLMLATEIKYLFMTKLNAEKNTQFTLLVISFLMLWRWITCAACPIFHNSIRATDVRCPYQIFLKSITMLYWLVRRTSCC